jgi:predicted transcriptional regulator
MTEAYESISIVELVAGIVAAYVSNNELNTSEIPALIWQIHDSLCGIESGRSHLLGERSEPAVPVEESIQPDYIVCLEDGRHLKMLKRHLRTAYGMDPAQYRERWGLPSDYPMVAPNYVKRRSDIAKHIGLGTSRKRQDRAA